MVAREKARAKVGSKACAETFSRLEVARLVTVASTPTTARALTTMTGRASRMKCAGTFGVELALLEIAADIRMEVLMMLGGQEEDNDDPQPFLTVRTIYGKALLQ